MVQAASAETFCVDDSSCTGTSEPDLQSALTAAASNGEADDIHLGAGPFAASGGFTYPISTDAVTIAGAGATTELSSDAGATTFSATGGPVTLQDLKVDVPAGGTGVELDSG